MELSEKYDLRVPRYTSYPTAPHFGPHVDSACYARWLASLDPSVPVSVYLHIPFCDEMCWFCGCYTKVVRRYEPIAAYLHILQREVALVSGATSAPLRVSHVHWGGGSPTMLRPDDWLSLVGTLQSRFRLDGDAELAVELDPRETTESYVKALARAGVNRVSIGVQDFDPAVQAAINRFQPFDVVSRVVGWLRAHGIARINLDLMYGLPWQTVAGVIATVEQAASLQPSRLALFGYAHVPWMKSHQRLIDESALPDARERLQQLTAASDRLLSLGFRPVGLDHFARDDDPLLTALGDGRLRRNFQGYTTDDAPVLIGLGASAIGSLPQGYVQNTSPLADYRRRVSEGRFATGRGIELNADDRLRRAIIETLMCTLSVDLGAVCCAHATDPGVFEEAHTRLLPLAEDGIITLQGTRIDVTPEGRPFVRLVAAAFDAYLEAGAKRHSRAV